MCGGAVAADATARRKVIIDQDAFGPAGSNMQAILMLLQSKDVEVLGITIPSGDGWRDEEVSHTLRLLEIAQRTDVPVYPGAVFPLVNTQARNKHWEALYGKLFYKGAWTEVWPTEGTVRRTPYHADPYLVPPAAAGEPKIKPARESAASFLVRKVHEFPGQVSIVAAGPLTNLALASRLDPQFSSLAKELVFMGGSFKPTAATNEFAAEYANAPRREFNMRWDPEAASIVLHEPWKKITQVPIDPTTATFFKPEFINRLDDIVEFQPLTREQIGEIVDLQIAKVAARLNERGVVIELTDAARELIGNLGYDPTYGARPLKRVIQKQLVDKLALKILEGEFVEGDLVRVDAEGGELIFAKGAI